MAKVQSTTANKTKAGQKIVAKVGQRVGVIGSGLGGLAAACVLAARGHQVVLFDKNPWLGGKAAVLHAASELGDFRFDMGPTILTVPAVLERIFAEAGENMHDWLDLKRLDPQWRCFFTDGGVLDLAEDVATAAENIRAFTGDAAMGDGYEQFLALSENLHRISENFFFWRSVEGISDTMNLKENLKLSTLKDVLALRMGQSVAGTIRRHVPDARVSQMLDHYTQYVGSSPYASPAVLCAIAHMQASGGVWYPMGGTRAVPEALMKLATKLGVDLRPGVEIAKVEVAEGRVCGVTDTQGHHTPLNAVVSNMDSVRTYAELVPEPVQAAFAKQNRYEAACSGVVLYLGLNKRYEHLAHHNFIFSRDAKEEFTAIYDRAEPAPDPTCYVAAPSSTEPGVAPAGGEALYVLVHTPALQGHDWKTLYQAYRQVILDKLKTTGGMPDLESRIVTEACLTPQDIHERYKVLNGAIYGLASHGLFTGAFKPGNRSKLLPGLYLAGGAAHPGPGMPMVMMSGWIAADALDQDAKAQEALAAAPTAA
jgi:phytoene desaturase